MTPARAKAIGRSLKRADEALVRDFYFEVMGAEFAGQVTVDRARLSIAEALVEKNLVCFFESQKGEHTMTNTNETPSTPSTDDLVGDTSTTQAAAQPDTAAGDVKPPKAEKKKASKKPGIANASKAKKTAKPKAEKKPYTPKVILLRDPEIVRRKDGGIMHIIGKCTWKEGGKFTCDATRKIHAADAFQVRYCKEHKLEATKAARRKAAKAKK